MCVYTLIHMPYVLHMYTHMPHRQKTVALTRNVWHVCVHTYNIHRYTRHKKQRQRDLFRQGAHCPRSTWHTACAYTRINVISLDVGESLICYLSYVVSLDIGESLICYLSYVISLDIGEHLSIRLSMWNSAHNHTSPYVEEHTIIYHVS